MIATIIATLPERRSAPNRRAISARGVCRTHLLIKDSKGVPKAMLKPNTILIVEDEILICLELADYLRDCGYRVLEAANADEAIAVLQTDQQVDLIFSDDRCPVRLMDLASRLGREQADQILR